MKYEIHCMCPFCGQDTKVMLDADELDNYLLWKDRKLLIQEALPNVSPQDREALTTGICSECWDAMFKQDKEEEE